MSLKFPILIRSLLCAAAGLLVPAGALAADWIPMVSHLKGDGGVQWRTELRLYNVSDGPASVTLLLHTATGTLISQQALPAGALFTSADVVGLFTAADAAGALEIESDRGVLSMARIYNAQFPNEIGQHINSIPAEGGFFAGEAAYLQPLQEGGGFRTNLTLLNTDALLDGRVEIVLLNALGVLVGRFTVDVPPGQALVIARPYVSRFGLASVQNGIAVANILSGEHIHFLASVVEGPQADTDTVYAQKAPLDRNPGVPLLDPNVIAKFAQALVVPPVMPASGTDGAFTEYRIAARQFDQQVLPPGMPSTTVWGYGRDGDPLPGSGQPTSFFFPGFTLEARVNEPVRVEWINALKDGQGRFLPHLLTIDQTLHWANPPGPPDSMGMSPDPYLGPVPIATHVHGAHVEPVSDGYPESWYLPDASDIPSGYTTQGSHYGTARPAAPGTAVFEYGNDQRATTLWYHDHALGMTRANVYAGLAGFYLLRDAAEDALGLPGPAPRPNDPPGTKYYEMPIVIQDRTFEADGSLFYPRGRAFFDGYDGPVFPDSMVPPYWNPEFFGNAMVVNGKAWPYLEVEPRLYRLRLLNGCNSRTLILALDRAGLVFHRIGNEGGLLPGAPIVQDSMLLAPAERADVILDFSGFHPGEEITLLNTGPDEPFKGLQAPEPQMPADPATTGRVLKFRIVAPAGQGAPGAIPASLPDIPPLQTVLPPRDLTLNEVMEMVGPPLEEIPVQALLGTADEGPLPWHHMITEKPGLGDTEIWRILNLTEDAHPIHLHLVQFQVLDRTPFDSAGYQAAQQAYLIGGGPKPVVEAFFTGPPEAPRPEEAGFKETVIADPFFVTRIIATFDKLGLYVWHCHILEHEDNEMMRPFEVVAK